MTLGKIRLFIQSAGILLLVTAIAKLISSTGNAHMLNLSDPILFLSYRQVFCVIGTLELIIGVICLSNKSIGLQAGLVGCLSASFVVYRIGLIVVGYHMPSCSCLGNLTEALHISAKTANTAIGSYGTLLWLWWQNGKVSKATSPGDALISGV